MDLLGDLVGALRDAGMQANPMHICRFQRAIAQQMGEPVPLDDSDSDEDDSEPHVKVPPPIFKGIPGEHPDACVFAADDWMEAMHFRGNHYIDKFKHTLNHLARE